MSLHEPTLADLQQALEVVQEREREALSANKLLNQENIMIRAEFSRFEHERELLLLRERTICELEKRLRERNTLLTEANRIVVRQSQELTMFCEERTRLETELATLRAKA